MATWWENTRVGGAQCGFDGAQCGFDGAQCGFDGAQCGSDGAQCGSDGALLPRHLFHHFPFYEVV